MIKPFIFWVVAGLSFSGVALAGEIPNPSGGGEEPSAPTCTVSPITSVYATGSTEDPVLLAPGQGQTTTLKILCGPTIVDCEYHSGNLIFTCLANNGSTFNFPGDGTKKSSDICSDAGFGAHIGTMITRTLLSATCTS